MLRDHLDAWLSLLPDGGADVAFEFSLQAAPVRNASGTIERTVGHATQCLSAETAAGRVILGEDGDVCLQPTGGGDVIRGFSHVRAALDRARGVRLGHGWIIVDADRGGEPEPGNVACAYCGTERSFVVDIAAAEDGAVCVDATEAAAAARGLLPRLPGEAWTRPASPPADGVAAVVAAATENAAVALCRRIASALFMQTSVSDLRRRGGADIPAELRDALLAVNSAAVGGSGTYHTPRLVVDLQIDGVPVVRMPLDVEGLPESTRRDLVEGRGGHALSIAIAQPVAMTIPFESDPARWLLLRHAGLPADGRRTVANIMIEPDDAWRWGALSYGQWAVEADADVELLRGVLRPSIGSGAAAQLLRHLQTENVVLAQTLGPPRLLVCAPPAAEACVRLLRSMAASSVWEATIADDGSAQTQDGFRYAAGDVAIIFRSTLRGPATRADRSGVAITVNVENNGAAPEAVADAVRAALVAADPPYADRTSSYSNLAPGRPLTAENLTEAMRRMRAVAGNAIILAPSPGDAMELIAAEPAQLRRRDDETREQFTDRVRDRAAELARSAMQPYLDAGGADEGWSGQSLRAAGLARLASEAATLNLRCRFEDRERGRRLLIEFPANTLRDVADRFVGRCHAHVTAGVDIEWAWRTSPTASEWAIAGSSNADAATPEIRRWTDVRPQGAPLSTSPLPCPRCNPASLSGVYCARHLTEANVRRLALQEGGRSQPHVWVEQTDGSQRCDDCGRYRSDNVGPDCEARPVLPPSAPGFVFHTTAETRNPCSEVALDAPATATRMTIGAQAAIVDGQTVGRLTTNDRGQVVGVVVDVAPDGMARVDLDGGSRRGVAERQRAREDAAMTPDDAAPGNRLLRRYLYNSITAGDYAWLVDQLEDAGAVVWYVSSTGLHVNVRSSGPEIRNALDRCSSYVVNLITPTTDLSGATEIFRARSRRGVRDVVTTPPGVTVTQSPGGPVMVRVSPDAAPTLDEVARAINEAGVDVVARPAPDGNGVVVRSRTLEGRVAFVSTPYTPQDMLGRLRDGGRVAREVGDVVDGRAQRPDLRDYVLRDLPSYVVDVAGDLQRSDAEPQVVRARRSEAIVRLGVVDAATASAMVGMVLRTAGSGPGSDDQIVGVLTEVRNDGTATVRFPIGRAERDAMARPGYRMRGVAAPVEGSGDAERARIAALGARIAASLRGPRAVEYGPSGRPRPRNRPRR